MTDAKPSRPSRGKKKKQEISLPWFNACDLHPDWRWERFFGRGGPVEVELGCGKGGWLIGASAAKPDTNFLGVDYAGKYLRKAGERLSARDARNVALLYSPHEAFLCDLPPESVDAFHIYFPDPWHKDRHAKRRWFLLPEALQWLHAALKPGGLLMVRTDVPSYFDNMLSLLERFEAGFEIGEPVLYGSPPRPDWILTNYEAEFLKEGIDCFAVGARKKVLVDPK
jgi:tRNA (guanine-N7-)-methyltransferase